MTQPLDKPTNVICVTHVCLWVISNYLVMYRVSNITPLVIAILTQEAEHSSLINIAPGQSLSSTGRVRVGSTGHVKMLSNILKMIYIESFVI